MNQTIYEKGIKEGIEKGIEKGRRQGQLELLIPVVEGRFGLLPQVTRDYLEKSSPEELQQIAKQLFTASSLTELGLPE